MAQSRAVLGDGIVLFALCLGIAMTMTAWMCILYGLAARPPRWHAFAAFFVPPLAIFFAYRERMRARFGFVVLGMLIEGVALFVTR